MTRSEIAGTCPYDACPLQPFAAVKVGLGWTITLHGCHYCDFNHVVGVAADVAGRSRLVAVWGYKPDERRYVLAEEHGHNPPDWLDLADSALPKRTQE
jgi:hypothetical protein